MREKATREQAYSLLFLPWVAEIVMQNQKALEKIIFSRPLSSDKWMSRPLTTES